MIVQHNMSAENTNRQLGMNVKVNTASMEKLSSGYRINRAADDAAGLAISEKMRTQIRGLDKASFNCGDGMSLIQVADGALGEVHSMLDRLKELSVQAANDTLVYEDREAIQDEVAVLLAEIDRIGDETEFNTIKVFQGERLNYEGWPVGLGDVSLGDLSRVISGERFNRLPFSAGYMDENGVEHEWNFFGNFNGDTLIFPCRIQVMDGNSDEELLWLDSNPVVTSDIRSDSIERKVTRNFSDMEIDVSQKVHLIQEPGSDYKYYEISFEFENKSDKELQMDFIFAGCTGIYEVIDNIVNGGVVRYSIDGNYLVGDEGVYINPNSIFISDVITPVMLEKLPFIQKLDWDANNQPTKFVIDSVFQNFWRTGNAVWQYVDSLVPFVLSDDETSSTYGSGIGMTSALIWEGKHIPAAHIDENGNTVSGKTTITWRHGIVPSENGTSEAGQYTCRDLWIQSGANAFGGQYLELREMNTTVLGIHDIDMLTDDSATEANDKIEAAINAISNHRATLGAQYNRLEHAQAVDDNSEENVQASESKIRDTDMAKEMVVHAAKGILIHAGQAMLAQTNQITEGVLRLLR